MRAAENSAQAVWGAILESGLSVRAVSGVKTREESLEPRARPWALRPSGVLPEDRPVGWWGDPYAPAACGLTPVLHVLAVLHCASYVLLVCSHARSPPAILRPATGALRWTAQPPSLGSWTMHAANGHQPTKLGHSTAQLLHCTLSPAARYSSHPTTSPSPTPSFISISQSCLAPPCLKLRIHQLFISTRKTNVQTLRS